MEIVSIETFRTSERPNLLHVEVTTSDGRTGLGETFWSVGAVEAHIHEVLADKLLGQDASRIEWLNLQMRSYLSNGSTGAEIQARSVIDMALWDLLGQAAGMSLTALLGGGTRARVPIYNTCVGPNYVQKKTDQTSANWGIGDDRLEDMKASFERPGWLAEDLLKQGCKAMKFVPFDEYAYASGGQYISGADVNAACQALRDIRSAVGHEMEIIIELHGLWCLPAAIRIAHALEGFDVLFIEDPMRPEDLVGLATLRERVGVPIALSEMVGGAHKYAELLERGALDIAIPDISWTGGVTEAKKIAAIADSRSIPVTVHDCTGPAALAFATHYSCAIPNGFIQETVRAYYHSWYRDILTELPPLDHGFIMPPAGSGLGTRLRDDYKARPDMTRRASRLA